MVTATSSRRPLGFGWSPGVEPVRLGLGALLAVSVAGGGALAASHPAYLVLGLAAVAVLVAMVLRVEWALLAYLALAPFGGYLKTFSPVSIKVVGALLFTAWLLRLATRTRPLQLRHPAVTAAAALALAVLAAATLHANGWSGVEVAGRYLSYICVLVVLVDSLRSGLRARLAAAVFVASCGGAAVASVVFFLVGGVHGRATLPGVDPNDFAFFLVCAIPLGLSLTRMSGTRRVRLCWWLAVLLMVVGIMLTLSRGGLLGLVAAFGYVLVTRQVRIRALLAGLLIVAAGVALLVVLRPELLSRSLMAKQSVADQNVQDRFTTWTMAARMTADSPVLGQGPGGFKANYEGYVSPHVLDMPQLDVVHNTYLQTSSDLGLLGLGAFTAMIALGGAGARRACRAGPSESREGSLLGVEGHDQVRPLAQGVCASLLGVLVAATFLSEQYYLPIWFLAALGAALDPGPADAPTGSAPDDRGVVAAGAGW